MIIVSFYIAAELGFLLMLSQSVILFGTCWKHQKTLKNFIDVFTEFQKKTLTQMG